MPDSQKIPIHVVTGFLGSGKTTLLNRLLAAPELGDTAVLINEFGEVGLDHLLVDAVDEDIVLLESGCVCCSVRDDFRAALLNLHDKRRQGLIPSFQRVILETTGIADPSTIHELILSDGDITRRYGCRAILAVVDAVYGGSNLDRHVEAVKQVSVADRLIIAKTDLCEDAALADLERRLRRLNPLAPIAHAGREPVNPGIFSHDAAAGGGTGSLRPGAGVATAASSAHDRRFTTFALGWPEAVAWDDFVAWLEALLVARGDSIHRVKGLLRVQGEARPVVVQGVQHSYYQPVKLDGWPGEKAATELVFITSDFSRQAAINSLEQILDVSVA